MHGSCAESEDYDYIVLTLWPPNVHCALFSKKSHNARLQDYYFDDDACNGFRQFKEQRGRSFNRGMRSRRN